VNVYSVGSGAAFRTLGAGALPSVKFLRLARPSPPANAAAPAERDRVNQSTDHLDVSIGSDEVSVTGHDRTGREHALLHAGRWQF